MYTIIYTTVCVGVQPRINKDQYLAVVSLGLLVGRDKFAFLFSTFVSIVFVKKVNINFIKKSPKFTKILTKNHFVKQIS